MEQMAFDKRSRAASLVNWLTAEFQPDTRAGVVPKLEKFPVR
jgi:hypothetical protein